MDSNTQELRKVAASSSKYSETAENLLTIEELVKRFRKARGFDRERARVDIFEAISDLTKSFPEPATSRLSRKFH
jgi:hypothetical protein